MYFNTAKSNNNLLEKIVIKYFNCRKEKMSDSSEIEDIREEIREKREEIREKREEIRDKREEKEEKENELRDLKELLDKYKELERLLNEIISNLRSAKIHFNNGICLFKENYKSVSEIYKSKETEQDYNYTILCSIIDDFNDNILPECKERIKTIENEIKELEDEIEELEDEIKELEEEIEDLKEDIEDLKDELEDLQDDD